MKKNLILPIFAAILSAFIFTSCDDEYYVIEEDYYYDRDIPGQWDLVYVNGHPVAGFDQNFFDFYTDGTGKYYYYEDGYQYWEWIEWWCYEDYYSYAPVLHIEYSSGAPLDCDYSFNSDATLLYMSWISDRGRRQEYVYQYVGPAEVKRREVEKIMRGTTPKDTAGVSSSMPRPGKTSNFHGKK